MRWSRSAGGQVIGSLSAVGDIVYVAEFTNKTTSGFMMRSGRRVFRYPKGTYTPVISDGRRIYLTGYSSITALRPHRAGGGGRREAQPRRVGAGKARSGGGRGGTVEAGRVVLDPVAAGAAEVLVVDEHLAARVAFHPGEELADEARVVAAFDPPLGDREGLAGEAAVEAGQRLPFRIAGVEVGADPVDPARARVEVARAGSAATVGEPEGSGLQTIATGAFGRPRDVDGQRRQPGFGEAAVDLAAPCRRRGRSRRCGGRRVCTSAGCGRRRAGAARSRRRRRR